MFFYLWSFEIVNNKYFEKHLFWIHILYLNLTYLCKVFVSCVFAGFMSWIWYSISFFLFKQYISVQSISCNSYSTQPVFLPRFPKQMHMSALQDPTIYIFIAISFPFTPLRLAIRGEGILNVSLQIILLL